MNVVSEAVITSDNMKVNLTRDTRIYNKVCYSKGLINEESDIGAYAVIYN